MNNEMMKERIQQALNAELSGLRTSPMERDRLYENAIGGTKVKRKLTAGLVLALVLVLMMAAAVAAVLLTRQEIVEQVAVPMAMENDQGAGVEESYTPEQLAQLIQTLNENGFTMEENNRLMQAIRNGQGYWEEETLMEICRQAFGGNFYTWTLEQQDWYQHLMVDIGFYESYDPCLPGEGNMKYEEAEAFAFARLKKEYGEDLKPEDRDIYTLSRQFYHDAENAGTATWSFTLDPKDIDHGMFSIRFEDQDPEGTAFCQADIPDWSKPYTGDRLMSRFQSVYSWFCGKWPQSAWQRLHEMMQSAELKPEDLSYPDFRGYQMTEYPEPKDNEITRDDAVRIAKEALKLDRAALNSAVLTEYEGDRSWMVGLIIYRSDDGSQDDEAGTYVITIDSETGEVMSLRKATKDDGASMAFVPEKAYDAAREGILRGEDYLRLAAEAIRQMYPDVNPLDENEYESRDRGGVKKHNIVFVTKSIRHGNASSAVAPDGTVSEVTADVEPLNGDNLFSRYTAVYGYYGQWEQGIWVKLRQDMDPMEPSGIEGKLLKLGRYPEENSVSIDHVKAQELAIKASGKRTAEINTCVLMDAEPHPVWKLRVIADDPADQVIELDAETGEVLGVDIYRTDYTPSYVLYSLEKNWRRLELETDGPVQMAKKAITYKYGDLWLDFPELDVENPDEYEIQQEGLKVQFVGRWKGMKDYLVELDDNGSVLRCEETASKSTEERSSVSENTVIEGFSIAPTPTPQPDGKPWFWGMDFAPQDFWDQLDKLFFTHVMTMDDYPAREKDWLDAFGPSEFWPQEYQVVRFLYLASEEELKQPGLHYPVFPGSDRKSQQEICKIALNAFHGIADAEMGKEWVDSVKTGCTLLSDEINPDTGVEFGKHVWWVNFNIWDDEFNLWNSKGYAILDEDGNVLTVKLELSGNG